MSTDTKAALEALKSRRLVISEEGLERIAAHKYVPGICTPIDNVMNTYVWTPLVHCLPQWLAPNAVTCTGLVIQILGFAAVAYHCVDFRDTAPPWAYGAAAASTLIYQTLDALDGKQARRTGSSSPLGQLFDHGCDSVVTIFLGMLNAMCLHLGFCVRCVLFLISMLLPFWIAQWTEYHTHTLPTNLLGLIGVTEAQFVCVFIMAANLISPTIWNITLGVGDMPGWWCGRETCPVTTGDFMVFSQVGVAIVSSLTCMMTVAKVSPDPAKALLQTLSIWILTLVGWLWCTMVPHAHPRLVLFTLGTSFSYLTCKMIVAAMSRTEYRTFQPILVPLPIILVVSKLDLSPRHGDFCLGCYTAVIVYSFACWVGSAMEEIATYIGIHKFHLGKRSSKIDGKTK